MFGQAAWEQSARKYFRFLHFTTEDARASSPAVLRFSFNLPPIGKVPPTEHLSFDPQLLALVMRDSAAGTCGNARALCLWLQNWLQQLCICMMVYWQRSARMLSRPAANSSVQ